MQSKNIDIYVYIIRYFHLISLLCSEVGIVLSELIWIKACIILF